MSEEFDFDYTPLPSMTKKRSGVGKRKKVGKSSKYFDLSSFKNKILNDLNKSGKSDSGAKSLINDYESRYKTYFQEGFTNNIVSFANKMIIDSHTLTDNLRNDYPIQHLVINVVKTLMMNELEITYLSLYLDIFTWETPGFSFEDNILAAAFVAKIYLNTEDIYNTIKNHVSMKRPEISKLIQDWIFSKEGKLAEISPKLVNRKFLTLSRSANPFCKNNFIDYNFIVDQILQMSLPYTDASRKDKDFQGFGPSFTPKANSVDIGSNLKGQINQEQSYSNYLTNIEKYKGNTSLTKTMDEIISDTAFNNQSAFKNVLRKDLQPNANMVFKMRRNDSDMEMDRQQSNLMDNFNQRYNEYLFQNNNDIFQTPDLFKQASNYSDVEKQELNLRMQSNNNFPFFSSINNNTNINNVTNIYGVLLKSGSELMDKNEDTYAIKLNNIDEVIQLSRMKSEKVSDNSDKDKSNEIEPSAKNIEEELKETKDSRDSKDLEDPKLSHKSSLSAFEEKGKTNWLRHKKER